MTDRPIVHLVDDDADVLASLVVALEAAGYGCQAYASGHTFLAAVAQSPLGCAVLDIRMPEIDGLAIMEELRRRSISLPVILMTGYGDVALAVRAMKAGAVDFIEKPCRLEELKDAIDRALALKAKADAQNPVDAAAPRVALLTEREREVFERLVVGESNKDIARKLDISVRTVENHRARLMEKIQARNLPELVRIYIRFNSKPISPEPFA